MKIAYYHATPTSDDIGNIHLKSTTISNVIEIY
jgi:hypothetical protein